MTTLSALFISMSAYYGLPPGLLSSVCYVESKHNISALHKHDGNGDSIGVCQIKLKTARHMGFHGTEAQLMIPRNNVKYAAKYLSYQMKRYHNINKAIIAYNYGNAKSLTSTKYQRKVIKKWGQYICSNLTTE